MTVSLRDPRMAADALRGIVVTAASTDQKPHFLMFRGKPDVRSDVSSGVPSNSSASEKDIRETTVGQRISVSATFEFVVCELSIAYVTSVVSLLLPRVIYSFSTNLFKQLQRQSSQKLGWKGRVK